MSHLGRLERGGQVGRFQLVKKLATGGMAEVWLARASAGRGIQRMAVVKAIHAHLTEDEYFLSLFRAEADLAERLNHPNIAHFIEHGTEDGRPFMTLEFVLGRTTKQIQRAFKKAHRALPPWFALRIGIDVCHALDHAHELRDEEGKLLGVVHRDVTPENVMVTFSGVTKVVDFGVAKTVGGPSVSAVGSATGKLAYLAPEQVTDPSSAYVDRRTDIYCLGVLLYELLTGVQPIRASNDMSLLLKIPRQKPPPPSAVARWIPSALSTTVMSTLAKHPDDRYQTAAELADALECCLEHFDVDPTERQVSTLLCNLFPAEERRLPFFDDEDDPRRSSQPAAASSPPLDFAERLKR